MKSKMALPSYKVLVCTLLLALGNKLSVHARDADDGITVETVEELDYYTSPTVDPHLVHLAESFDDANAFKKKWVKSEAKKQGVDDEIAKYDGEWEINVPARKILSGDSGLVLMSEAKHAAISALLDKPFEFKDKPLVVQYEVTMQEGQVCGGAYLKLLSKGTSTKADLRKFHDQTPYTIMFGPDKCGNDNKLHFIFRHRNPVNGTVEEKHCKKANKRLDDIYKDKEPHLYTLIVNPDNTYRVLVDNAEVNSGSLLEDFTPPVNPPEEISDPEDRKPDDWDERENIVDPTARKPDDWDESAPAQIPDPNAVKPDGWLDDEPDVIPDPTAEKPADWDEDMDGEWEAPLVDNPACGAAPGCGHWKPPMIPNPLYKGIWRAPTIPNPNYRGKWSPRTIKNPHYFNDQHPFKMTPIHAVGFELWSMSPRLLFDNLIITDEPAVAERWALQTFALKRAKISKESDSVVERALKYTWENPWVLTGALLAVVFFIGLLLYMCCRGSPVEEEDPKKTDAVQEDDPQDEADEDEEQKERVQHVPGCKSDLELEEPLLDDDTEGQEVPLVEKDGSGDAQKKRKPRKE